MTQALAPTQRLAGFAASLRDHGMTVGVAEQQAMLQAALHLGAVQEKPLQAAWRAIACHNRREWNQWPEVYERYWHPEKLRGHVKVSGKTRPSRDLRQSVQHMHEQMDQQADATGQPPGSQTTPQTSADQPASDHHVQDAGSQRAMGGASRTDPLHQRDAQMWLPQDLSALQTLARQITERLRPLPTRRYRAAQPGQKLDFRKTLRDSVACGGELLQPAWKVRRVQPPRLFLLVDVSRSMESHAAFFLRVARAFAIEAQARVFVFHTRLAEVTTLMQRDSAVVQEKINAVTAGFGAGTRIAASLHEFARNHARAQLGRSARVWIFSDGFDTDEPQQLAQELQALRGHGARVTWFHPTRNAPAAAAVQGARSLIERFVPLASLTDLQAAHMKLR